MDVHETIIKLAKFISMNSERFTGDHACAQCHPRSEIIVDGFECGYHLALRILGDGPKKWTPAMDSRHRDHEILLGEKEFERFKAACEKEEDDEDFTKGLIWKRKRKDQSK